MGVTPRGCIHEGAFDVGAVEGGAGRAGKRRRRVRAFKGLAGAGGGLGERGCGGGKRFWTGSARRAGGGRHVGAIVRTWGSGIKRTVWKIGPATFLPVYLPCARRLICVLCVDCV